MKRCLTVTLLVAAAAFAAPRPAAAAEQGTHLIGELELGVGMPPEGTHLIGQLELGVGIPPVGYFGPGFTYGGIIGIGGKFKDFPPRFYLIAGASTVAFSGGGTHLDAGVAYSADRTYVDIFGGLRVVIPIYDAIRLYADILGGALYVGGSIVRDDGASLAKQDWSAEWAVALGLEYRWHENASTGFRVEGVFGSEEIDVLDVFSGSGDSGTARLNVLLTQAWYV